MAKKSSLKISESTVSMFLGALVVVIVASLVFNYFKNINRSKEKTIEIKEEQALTITPKEEAKNKTITTKEKKYKVKAGDYLWKIAESQYRNGYYWVNIAQENKIINPDLIYPNQELILPEVEAEKGKVDNQGAKVSSEIAITSNKYQVVKGDNLWNIAVRACGDGFKWTKLSELNHLANPDLIHSGNKLKIVCK